MKYLRKKSLLNTSFINMSHMWDINGDIGEITEEYILKEEEKFNDHVKERFDIQLKEIKE